MSGWPSVLLWLAAMLAARAGWQEELTPGPGSFPPLRPFHAHYKFGWSMLSAAEADFNYTRSKEGIGQLAMSTRSIGAVRALWKMDAQARRHAAGGHAAPARLHADGDL